MIAKLFVKCLIRTFDYIKRELPKGIITAKNLLTHIHDLKNIILYFPTILVPTNIPVMVLANHRDMGHHRCVSEDDVKYFIESLER